MMWLLATSFSSSAAFCVPRSTYTRTRTSSERALAKATCPTSRTTSPFLAGDTKSTASNDAVTTPACRACLNAATPAHSSMSLSKTPPRQYPDCVQSEGSNNWLSSVIEPAGTRDVASCALASPTSASRPSLMRGASSLWLSTSVSPEAERPKDGAACGGGGASGLGSPMHDRRSAYSCAAFTPHAANRGSSCSADASNGATGCGSALAPCPVVGPATALASFMPLALYATYHTSALFVSRVMPFGKSSDVTVTATASDLRLQKTTRASRLITSPTRAGLTNCICSKRTMAGSSASPSPSRACALR
mmetsp:Transcript_0/g.2  ORF Transcript_0/g.2 Transcript_0/m.2 type:complete len:306 (+) Transcript_0:218-1135(+)